MDVNDGEDYLSRRSLVEFRHRLVAKDPEMKLVRTLFDSIRDSAIKGLGLSTSSQRLDSTHIVSNIRTRGRVALFSNTLDLFLEALMRIISHGYPRGSVRGMHKNPRAGSVWALPSRRLNWMSSRSMSPSSSPSSSTTTLASPTGCLPAFSRSSAKLSILRSSLGRSPKEPPSSPLTTRMPRTDIRDRDTVFT